MQVPFSQRPGRHERHFRRRLENSLFPRPQAPSDEDLTEAQRLDHEELVEFVQQLRDAVQQAVDLKPNEESQVLLDLKGELERLYLHAAGLAEDQEANQAAISQLVDLINRTLRRASTGDATAMQELDQEDVARDWHHALLKHAIVADLLHPESLIEADELAPVLLSEDEQGLAAALALFDAAQLDDVLSETKRLLEDLPADQVPPRAGERLAQIREHRERLG